jgi:7-carboxy-7-deazaguanine synthase
MSEKQNYLIVNEIFNSLQGEGPSTGHQATFLRLYGCNLACNYCDSAYTWRTTNKYEHTWDNEVYNWHEESHRMTIPTLHAKLIDEKGGELLVITGGEPLLQSQGIFTLIKMLENKGQFARVEVETNGTIYPDMLAEESQVHFNVSPKIVNSGMRNQKLNPIRENLLLYYVNHPRTIWKMVCSTDKELSEIYSFTREYRISPQKVWVMPKAETKRKLDKVSKRIIDRVLWHGFNFSTRLHISLWGNDRGK